jgi:hypothetical protein
MLGALVPLEQSDPVEPKGSPTSALLAPVVPSRVVVDAQARRDPLRARVHLPQRICILPGRR